jgi:hypothetical protein
MRDGRCLAEARWELEVRGAWSAMPSSPPLLWSLSNRRRANRRRKERILVAGHSYGPCRTAVAPSRRRHERGSTQWELKRMLLVNGWCRRLDGVGELAQGAAEVRCLKSCSKGKE